MKQTFLLTFLLLLLVGCQMTPFVGPIVTGVIMWKDGDAHKYYRESPETMRRSVKSSLKELNLVIHKETKSGNDSYFVAGDGDRFKIHIVDVKNNICKVSIRINYLGDKPYAELVYRTIDANTDTIDFENGKPIKTRRRL